MTAHKKKETEIEKIELDYKAIDPFGSIIIWDQKTLFGKKKIKKKMDC